MDISALTGFDHSQYFKRNFELLNLSNLKLFLIKIIVNLNFKEK